MIALREKHPGFFLRKGKPFFCALFLTVGVSALPPVPFGTGGPRCPTLLHHTIVAGHSEKGLLLLIGRTARAWVAKTHFGAGISGFPRVRAVTVMISFYRHQAVEDTDPNL